MSPTHVRGIDIHTHVVPGSFPGYRGTRGAHQWPSMAPAQPCHCHVMINGASYRTVPDTSWLAAKRLPDMDEAALARQILSPMPELLSYWLPPEDAHVLLRHVNETIATMVSDAPTRFGGLGGVPLQDLDAAIAELEFLMRDLGLHGAEIGTHVNGVSIGDPQFEPFFATARALGASIFVHAIHPAGRDRLVGAGLEQLVAFPGDVGLAITSMITGGTLERLPGLRMAFSHGGGAFAMMLPRLEHGWKTSPALKNILPRSPSSYAREFWYDTLVYDAAALRHVASVFGTDRLCLGSDYPFQIRERDPVGAARACGFDEQTTLALLEGNAKRFLGIDAR